jgi:hypothetical protein
VIAHCRIAKRPFACDVGASFNRWRDTTQPHHPVELTETPEKPFSTASTQSGHRHRDGDAGLLQHGFGGPIRAPSSRTALKALKLLAIPLRMSP